jgi:hypothetical protein
MPFVLTTGFNQQQTIRNSDLSFEQINLVSQQLNSGIDIEFIPQFHLLAGINLLNATGNEILPVRKPNGEIYNFRELRIYLESKYGVIHGNILADITTNVSEDILIKQQFDMIPYSEINYSRIHIILIGGSFRMYASKMIIFRDNSVYLLED